MSRFLQFFLKGAWPRAWLRLTLAAGAAIGVPFISVYPVLRKFLIKFSGPSARNFAKNRTVFALKFRRLLGEWYPS